MVKENVSSRDVREPNIKKRRKTSNSTSEATKPDVDIYKVRLCLNFIFTSKLIFFFLENC